MNKIIKKSIIVLAILCVALLKTHAQNGYYFRFELGPTFDVFQYTDNGNELGARPVSSGNWGLAFGKELTPLFTLETGFYWNYYAENYYFKTLKMYSGTTGIFDTWQIPLRLKGGIHIYRDVVIFGTTVGINYVINPENKNNTSGSGQLTNLKDTVTYNYSPRQFLKKNFFLLETGLFLDLKLFKGFHLCLTGSYYTGFKKLYENTITYQINNSSPQVGALTTNGDYFNFLFGLKYVIHSNNK